MINTLIKISIENSELSKYLNHLNDYNHNLQLEVNGVKKSKLYKFKVFIYSLIEYLNRPFEIFKDLAIKKEMAEFEKGPTIIEFGCIPWGFRYQRPQYLASEMINKGCRVLYLNPTFEELPIKSFKRITKNLYTSNVFGKRNISIHFHTPIISEIRAFNKWLANLLDTYSINRYVIKVDHPFWLFFLKDSKHRIIYDCMDNHSAFDFKHPEIKQIERSLVKRVDHVVVSSSYLKNMISSYGPKKIRLIRNGVNYEMFREKMGSSRSKVEVDRLARPILGYYGAICEWFDVVLLKKICERFPEYTVVIIGKIDNAEVLELSKFNKNLHLLGEKKHSDIPLYLKSFDVCLIPFVINDLIRATNPVKVYEYFSSGKPVVTTAVPELKKYSDILYFSADHDSFLENLDKAMNEKNNFTVVSQRKHEASKNSWISRGKAFTKILDSLDY